MPMGSRWEWRAFQPNLGTGEAAVRALSSLRHSTHEIYILSDCSHDSAKIRDRRLEVKTLEAVQADGLQCWQPIINASFPLDLTAIDQVMRRLGVSSPPLRRRLYSVGQWLDEVVACTQGLRACSLVTIGRSGMLNGCLVEIANVSVDGTCLKMVSVEMQDPARVVRTVGALGFDQYPHEDYVTALKRLTSTFPAPANELQPAFA
jgi:exopolyphosphatase/guanosine-5'-triphosphate,3'-diphosphate pyrophosphatase